MRSFFSTQTLADPEVLRCLTSSVSSALDEAAAALTRMRAGTNYVTASRSQQEYLHGYFQS